MAEQRSPILAALIGILGADLEDLLDAARSRADVEETPEEHAARHRKDLEEFQARRDDLARTYNPTVADKLIEIKQATAAICLADHQPVAIALNFLVDILATGNKAAITSALVGLRRIVTLAREAKQERDELAETVADLVEHARHNRPAPDVN